MEFTKEMEDKIKAFANDKLIYTKDVLKKSKLSTNAFAKWRERKIIWISSLKKLKKIWLDLTK